MYHAKRFGFFGTVLVCTVLLTACPGKWPFVPGVVMITIANTVYNGSVFDERPVLCLAGMEVSITSNGAKVLDIPRLDAKATFAGDRNGYMNAPVLLRTGNPLRIEVRCYGEENEQIGYYLYEDTIQYPIMSRSGTQLYINGVMKAQQDDCIPGQQIEGWADEMTVCLRTNLFER